MFHPPQPPEPRHRNVAELLQALQTALQSGELKPEDEVIGNEVGNIALLREGGYIGYIDLRRSYNQALNLDDSDEQD